MAYEKPTDVKFIDMFTFSDTMVLPQNGAKGNGEEGGDLEGTPKKMTINEKLSRGGKSGMTWKSESLGVSFDY